MQVSKASKTRACLSSLLICYRSYSSSTRKLVFDMAKDDKFKWSYELYMCTMAGTYTRWVQVLFGQPILVPAC